MELGSAAIAVAITLYFWRVNIRGIHESSDKALKIMGATTVMGVIMIVWCLVDPGGPSREGAPAHGRFPTSRVKQEPILDALGQPARPARLPRPHRRSANRSMRGPGNVHWFSLLGVLGILVAFGHSILAMSGEETLAQVYREVESPKLKNFKKAAFVVFVYSLLLTSLISFFAVMIIPDDVRISKYQGNLIGGLAMNVVGPQLGAAGAQRAGRRRRVPDPLGSRQHGDRRLQRRARTASPKTACCPTGSSSRTPSTARPTAS